MPNGLKHHFRCRRCNQMYLQWMKDSHFCKFNKVLVMEDPNNPNQFIVIPAWWTDTSEQRFANILSECSLLIQLGDSEMEEVTYNNIQNVISEKIRACHRQATIFEQVEVPGPYSTLQLLTRVPPVRRVQ